MDLDIGLAKPKPKSWTWWRSDKVKKQKESLSENDIVKVIKNEDVTGGEKPDTIDSSSKNQSSEEEKIERKSELGQKKAEVEITEHPEAAATEMNIKEDDDLDPSEMSVLADMVDKKLNISDVEEKETFENKAVDSVAADNIEVGLDCKLCREEVVHQCSNDECLLEEKNIQENLSKEDLVQKRNHLTLELNKILQECNQFKQGQIQDQQEQARLQQELGRLLQEINSLPKEISEEQENFSKEQENLSKERENVSKEEIRDSVPEAPKDKKKSSERDTVPEIPVDQKSLEVSEVQAQDILPNGDQKIASEEQEKVPMEPKFSEEPIQDVNPEEVQEDGIGGGQISLNQEQDRTSMLCEELSQEVVKATPSKDQVLLNEEKTIFPKGNKTVLEEQDKENIPDDEKNVDKDNIEDGLNILPVSKVRELPGDLAKNGQKEELIKPNEVTTEKVVSKQSKTERLNLYLDFMKLWTDVHSESEAAKAKQEANLVWKQRLQLDDEQVSTPDYLEQMSILRSQQRQKMYGDTEPDCDGAEFTCYGAQSSSVQVAGSFNDWLPVSLIEESPGVLSRRFPLPPGTYLYKYLIDDEWVVDPSREVVEDSEGNRNNQIIVESRASKCIKEVSELRSLLQDDLLCWKDYHADLGLCPK